ncbi:MAG: NAD(P)-dependent oxidoreductase, partial [Halobacteriaceae archaeon]
MDVLLIGSTGLVGSNIVRKIPEKHNIVQTSRNPGEEVNYCVQVRNSEQVNEVVEQVSPAYIINTAAYHDVDSCEDNRKMAFDVNCRGVRNLASAANKMGSKLITYSSDYVFSGENSSNQYSELDQVHPVNYYGQTKYAGEQAAKIAEEYTVLRPSVIYGLESDNFVTWVLGELEDGNEV